jgi:hypothetical protein
VDELSQARVSGRWLSGIAVWNPASGVDICSLTFVSFQVEVSATTRSLV